jgi:hypothetical protein
MSLKKGEVKVTSHGHKYEVMSGPHKGNNGVFYLVRDLTDGNVELKGTALVESFDGVKKNEQF